MARQRTQASTTEQFKCPECGRTFTRAAALGAHRRQAHGIAGATSQARRSRRTTRRTTARATSAAATTSGRRRRPTRAPSSSLRARTSRGGALDRDALLQQLFPDGIPAKENVIRAVNTWLDDAERLAMMK
jgi:uncharacterized C2H2 Zn-finger protein